MPTPLIDTMIHTALQAATTGLRERAKPAKKVDEQQLNDATLGAQYFLIAQKPDHSTVTSADIAAQAVIKSGMEKIPESEYARLGMGKPVFIGEEQEKKALMQTIATQPAIITDPIDGTSNFRKKSGRWAVSIGVADKGVTKASAVFVTDKSSDTEVNGTMYWAEAGTGAWKTAR